MHGKESPPLWIPRKVGTVTRYHRDSEGHYNMRHIMDPEPPGKYATRKWALFAADRRIWDVQPMTSLKAAIDAAEAWITGL